MTNDPKLMMLVDSLFTGLWLFVTLIGDFRPVWMYIVWTVALSLGWACTGLLWWLGRKLDHLKGLQ